MRIIPAIDIMGGTCVRLSEGNFNQSKTYYQNPVEVAKLFESNGIQYLHLIDLDGAQTGKVVNLKVLEQIATQTNLIIDFGGGVQSDKDIQLAFDAGASQITAGSIVVKNEPLFLDWLKRYGSERIILGADCKEGKIAINGWTTLSDVCVIEYINNYSLLGITHVISTDISKDGMLQGPSFELYASILKELDVHLIASGGITVLDDVIQLKQAGCAGVIIGKAIYEGTITFKELNALC